MILFDKALFAIMLAAAGDVTSTEYALSKPGVHEANPFIPNEVWQKVAMKAGVTVGVYYISRGLKSQGHPKWAKFVIWFNVGAWTVVTVNNIIVGRSAGGR